MKHIIRRILIIGLLLLPTMGVAATQAIISTPSNDTYGIMVIDSDGNCVSQTLTSQNYGAIIDWTVSLSRKNSNLGHIFTKDGFGNWIDSGRTVDLSIYGSSASSNLQNTYVEKSTDNLWPESTYIGTKATLVDMPNNERIQTRCGPSGTYAGAGAYLDYKITRCYAYFTEGNHVYVELYSKTVPVRRLYIPRMYFSHLYEIPQETLIGHEAILTSSVTARFGPGMEYDDFKEAQLSKGLEIQVFFEENGWVFAEFMSKIGNVRGWLPANIVETK